MPPRAAESQSDSEILISDQFSPREGDEKILFDVIEITGEERGKYKVRWEGNDPNTRRPWSQSWVPKRDCTDDLVVAWRRKKKEKERRNTKKNGRISTSSKRPSRSVASTARTKSRSDSIATSNATKRRNELSSTAGPSNAKSKSKHRFEEVVVKEEDESETHEELDIILDERRPASVSVGRSNAKSPTPNPPPSDLMPKGTKRKLAEAQSANSSTNQPSSRHIEAVPVEVDIDEGQTTRPPEVIFSNPPRKKRRITSEERPPARTLHGEKKNHTVRNGGGKKLQSHLTTNDEEDPAADGDVVEGGMVKVLSDGHRSAGMNNPNDKPRNGIVDGEKADKDKIVLLREEEEESDEVEIMEGPAQPRQPAPSNTTSTVRVTSKRPIARITVQPPLNRKAPSSNTHKKRAVATTGVPGSKAVNTTRPAATTKKPNDSSLVARSGTNRNPRESKPLFEPDSDSDRPPPLEWHRKHKAATKLPRNEGPDVVSVQILAEPDSQVNLSPRSRQRLELFDVEVMGKKMRVDEKKRPKEVDGRGEGSTLKRSSSSGNGRPATSTVRPTPRFDTTNMDVVPETEVENSQEDRLQSPSIAVKSSEKPNAVADVSAMDTSIVGPSISKPLRPIPPLSPSTFHPHLQPPNSSLPDTIIEPSSSHDRQAESDAIEQFESPEKERIPHTKTVVVLNKNGVIAEARNEPTTESDAVRRGQEIAEQVEARRRRVSASSGGDSSPETTKKKSMQEVVASAQSRSRSEGNASQPDENDDDDGERQQGEEEGVANASTSVVPPASGPPALSQDQPPPPVDDMSQPMKDDVVDFNGDMDVGGAEVVDETHDDDDDGIPAVINPELLRQEEEESTQDLMADLRQHQEQMEGIREINPADGWDLGPPPVDAPSPRLGSVNGDTHAPVSAEEPKIANHLTSSRSLQKGNQDDDDAPRGPITRSRSRSKTPSVLTISRTKARGKKKPLNIPSPVPSRRESAEPEAEPLKSPVDVFQNAQGSSAASSILAAQISSLQTQVHDKQAEIDSLQQALDSLREQSRLSEDRKTLLEADRQRQMTELQSQWADKKMAWEGERTLLAAQSAASEESRIQAEQDREFIREQYANASAYVTTVREENKELEQRAKIAEEQSKKGVELIKATFEAQVAKLQDEAKAWRRMGEFVIEKDTRTNDDIRRRAAEEPELRALCVRQKKALKETRAKVDGLQVDLQEKSSLCDASTAELEHCKRENARLQSDLNEALIKLDRLGRSGDESTQGDDHEFVYRCMWRVETDNTQSACPEVFAAMRELEQHIYSGHLA